MDMYMRRYIYIYNYEVPWANGWVHDGILRPYEIDPTSRVPPSPQATRFAHFVVANVWGRSSRQKLAEGGRPGDGGWPGAIHGIS